MIDKLNTHKKDMEKLPYIYIHGNPCQDPYGRSVRTSTARPILTDVTAVRLT